MGRTCRCINCITPPHMLKKLLESTDTTVREAALNTLLTTERLRGERAVRASQGFAAAPSQGRRTILDCQNRTRLSSAVVARTEDGEDSPDESVNRAFRGLGLTREFYSAVFDRNSIDDRGMRLDGYVHRGRKYNNAFWDGREMVFGDGDGVLFSDFTMSLDVIAHELAHGVTEHAAGLVYSMQPGALNESMSDVFGSLVKQWALGQTAAQADWLIGAEIFTPGTGADALRSMKAPGTAYNSPHLGRDPQPDHMSRFVQLPDTEDGDFGGVHINSGIPNRAFHVVAMEIGGPAWDAPGHIWYEALKASNERTQFQQFADTTHLKAGQLYGTGSAQQQAVVEGWREVGIRISGVPIAAGTGAGAGRARRSAEGRGDGGKPGGGRETDGLAALKGQIEALAAQVKALAKDVAGMKERA